jgi:hypothetical protein
MTEDYYMGNIKPDKYLIKVFAGLMLMLLFIAYISLYVMQNYFGSNFFSSAHDKHQIYILKSNTLKDMYIKYGMDYEIYKNRMDDFESLAEEYDFSVAYITANKLVTVKKNSILLALDMMSLSAKEIEQIDTFVKNGGNLFFNYTSGFLNASLRFQKKNLVTKIANLHLSQKYNTLKFEKTNNVFLSTRLLSPLNKYLPKGKALGMPLYDALPIYNTQKRADAYMTNWTQLNYVQIDKNTMLSSTESGVMWHGYKGAGKWVYCSLPSYVFSQDAKLAYKKLFHGILDYLNDKMTVMLYPYIDSANAIFVSEDTEYQYENLSRFNALSVKYQFPVTAFCVASLAIKHKSLMVKSASNKLLDIGSHSYRHKKIVGENNDVYVHETKDSKKLLESLTGREIKGFRPPREELDDKLKNKLKDFEYDYILGAVSNQLYPILDRSGMWIIPKHGRDDYDFLVHLDWSPDKILNEMKKEAKIITNLNGIYTLSTHTHLLNLGSNIKMTENFFKYVTTQKEMRPLNGTMIYHRISQRAKIITKSKYNEKKLILTVYNNNSEEVHNIHYEITVNPMIKLTGVESEVIGLKTKLLQESKSKYTFIIHALQPKSQIVLFVNYAKN